MWKPIPIEFEKNQKVNCMRIFFRKVIQNKFFYVAQKWTHFQRTGKWSEMDLEGLPGGSGWTQTKFKFRVIQNPPFTNINYNISTKLLVIEISWFKLTKKSLSIEILFALFENQFLKVSKEIISFFFWQSLIRHEFLINLISRYGKQKIWQAIENWR